MKQKILLLCLPLLIMMLPVKISSQAYPHDTLLIDGWNENSFYKGSCFCKVKVIKCDGEARGYRLHREIYDMCGEKDTSYTVIKSILSEGDEVLTGDDYDINTEDGKLKIQLENGIIIHFAEKTKITLDKDYCCNKNVAYTLKKGTICFESKVNDGTDVTCRTRNSIFNDILTLYTVESTDETDILKVYEGTVKASIQHPDNSESKDLGEKMKQLGQDYQAGKISADELAKKMKEYSERIKNISERMKPVNVEAGNKCTVTKSSLTVEQIESNDERWWEKF